MASHGLHFSQRRHDIATQLVVSISWHANYKDWYYGVHANYKDNYKASLALRARRSTEQYHELCTSSFGWSEASPNRPRQK